MNAEPTVAVDLFSEEAEEAILGSVLIAPDLMFDLKAFLTPEDFYFVQNRDIYDVMLGLHNKREAIDQLTVLQVLRSREQLAAPNGVSMASYLMVLVNHTPTHVHAETYARIVFAFSMRRRLLAFTSDAATLAVMGDQPLPAIMTKVNTLYQDVTVRLRSRSMVSATHLLDDIWADLEERLAKPSNVRGFSTGIQALDKMTMGLRAGLYAIGGASSMGKSTFAGGLVRALAKQGPGLLVPTEVKGEKALQKMATDMAGIPYKKYLSGYLNHDEVSNIQNSLSYLSSIAKNITVLDSEAPSVLEIEAEIVRSGAKWLVIDSGTAMAYQGMDTRHGKKQADLRLSTTWLCQQLQNIARQDVVVVSLWQTGRNAKGRESKVPRINDFKEAGAIEETADVCLALYRHEYYTSRKEADPDPRFPPGTATVFSLKDRDGGDGDDSVVLTFRPGHGFTGVVDPRLDGQDGR